MRLFVEKPFKVFLLSGIALYVLYLGVAIIEWQFYKNQSRYQTRPLPNFNLPTTTGDDLSNENLQGTITIFLFWHSGCGPCKPELRAIANLDLPAGWQIMPINDVEPLAKVKRFLQRNFVGQESIIDLTGTFRKRFGWPIYYLVENNRISGPLYANALNLVKTVKERLAGKVRTELEYDLLSTVIEIAEDTISADRAGSLYLGFLILLFFIPNRIKGRAAVIKILLALLFFSMVAIAVQLLAWQFDTLWLFYLRSIVNHLNEPPITSAVVFLLTLYLLKENSALSTKLRG